MHQLRQETEYGTEIYIFASQEALEARDVWQAYRVTCGEFYYDTQLDKRHPPTARIFLLTASGADIATVRQIAAEYAAVADVAEALQAEKRAAYAAKYGEG